MQQPRRKMADAVLPENYPKLRPRSEISYAPPAINPLILPNSRKVYNITLENGKKHVTIQVEMNPNELWAYSNAANVLSNFYKRFFVKIQPVIQHIAIGIPIKDTAKDLPLVVLAQNSGLSFGAKSWFVKLKDPYFNVPDSSILLLLHPSGTLKDAQDALRGVAELFSELGFPLEIQSVENTLRSSYECNVSRGAAQCIEIY